MDRWIHGILNYALLDVVEGRAAVQLPCRIFIENLIIIVDREQ